MTVVIEIKVPDVGDVKDINVVEVLVQAGDTIEKEQTLAILETDKASIDLPSSTAGNIQQVYIKAGDKVSEGSLIATVLANSGQTGIEEPVQQAVAPPASTPIAEKAPESVSPPAKPAPEPLRVEISQSPDATDRLAHASPSVRLFARELGVDVARIKTGSGRKGRILKDDVKNFVKKVMTEGIVAPGAGIPSIPAVDFSPFGETETQKLSKIKH